MSHDQKGLLCTDAAWMGIQHKDQDVCGGRRYQQTDQKLHEENLKLTGEYKRITEQFKDLQLKFRHFELVDTKKYDDVRAMKEAEVVGLAKKVMAADKVLHEQQLGLTWRGPAEDVRTQPLRA
jgi:dynein regulatry complex protein 1